MRTSRTWFGIATVLPAVLCIALLFGYPLVTNLLLSLTNRNLVRKDYAGVGWSNYARILRDPTTWIALGNGLTYALSTVALQVVLGFVCALILFSMQSSITQKVFRNLLLVPWATPFISGVFIWRWIYNDSSGLLNFVLKELGIITASYAWLGREDLAMFAVVAKAVWFGVPLMMISVLAGMQTIPRTQFDSAMLEGAGLVATIRYVIIPNVRNIVVSLAILRTIWTFNDFGSIYALTGGGPGVATQTLPILAYQTAWGRFQLGQSSALCVLMTIFLGLIIAVYYRLFRPETDWTA